MLKRMQQVRARHKMRLSFHFGASHLTLLSLALLCPRDITSYPHSPTTLQPMVDLPELESALLQTALDDLRDDWLVQPQWRQDSRLALLGPWDEDVLLRAQRGDLVAESLSPFPGGHPLEGIHYQERREGEDGGKRNEALTSIAGGLQAVSREKGGFGFRFGRKRWTDRGRMNEERGSMEEKEWK